MNRKVYANLLSTYGRRVGVWCGFILELLRAVMGRVISVIILAQIASAVARQDFTSAQHSIVLWAVLTFIANILSSFGELCAHRAENREYGRLGMIFYKKLANKDMSFYRNHKTGYLTPIYRQHVDSAMDLVRLIRGNALRTFVSLTGPIIILSVANWKIGLVALALMLSQVVYVWWSSAMANKYREASHEIYRRLSGEIADDITNIVAYWSSGSEQQAEGRLAGLIQQELRTFWKRRAMVIYLNLPRTTIVTALVASAFWIVLGSGSTLSSSVGLLVLTITYMFQIARNVDDLPDIISQHDELVTRLYPTFEVLNDEHETILDPLNPKKLAIDKGAIDIKNLTFHYVDDHNPKEVFRNLSLHIKGGESIGIVGLSGAGKSTLANLLMRFDDIQRGSIAIDGTNITNVRQSDLRAKIAYVPQEPLLFHRTIKENIAYHNPGASQAAIERAAKAAHAHDFIQDLPHGYNTIVGERGVKLSGGQKQRVVIARAILKQAPIILFDEATSALDSESEQIIQQALPEIIGRHTAIIIAHRLSTVANLDRIIVMQSGKIIEEGTHQALLQRKGRYYTLWQRQTSQL